MTSATTTPGTHTLWLGTYPGDGPDGPPGTGEGVWRVQLDGVTGELSGELVASTPAPSFLALSPDGSTLYAAGETAPGTVTAFAVAPDGGLTQRNQVASGGDAPCHLLVHPDGRALYVSNYVTGELTVLTLAPDGGFTPEAAHGPVQSFAHTGTGPDLARQEGPHAHSAFLAPGGAYVLVADLGTDQLRRYAVGADGTLAAAGVAHTFAPGTGPRHLAALAGGHHLVVVGELSQTLHLLAWDAATGAAREVQVLPVCASPLVSGDRVLASHVLVDGGTVLVGVRGADVVSRFTVHDDGAGLTHEGDVGAGGAWPRHMALAGGWLVVAVQGADAVTTLAWDGDRVVDGVAGRLAVPVPACVLPA